MIFILIILGLLLGIPLLFLILFFGSPSDSGSNHYSSYSESHDYHFPSNEILKSRLSSGYYDDDPDMLEIHDPDIYKFLYGDDFGSDGFDDDY